MGSEQHARDGQRVRLEWMIEEFQQARQRRLAMPPGHEVTRLRQTDTRSVTVIDAGATSRCSVVQDDGEQ